jgi:hypothetical protein
MRRTSTSAMGALHPFLFFVFVYGISLFLAVFICRTVYQSLNHESSISETLNSEISAPQVAATVYK